MKSKINVQRICAIEGCNRLTRNKGFYKGARRYDWKCGYHHKKSEVPYFDKRLNVPNTKCEVCGWDKAVCDRHRKIPSIGYTRENVVILCPNCHRLAGLDLIRFD